MRNSDQRESTEENEKEEQEKSRKRVEMKHDREYRYDARNKREVSSASEMLATKKEMIEQKNS